MLKIGIRVDPQSLQRLTVLCALQVNEIYFKVIKVYFKIQQKVTKYN